MKIVEVERIERFVNELMLHQGWRTTYNTSEDRINYEKAFHENVIYYLKVGEIILLKTIKNIIKHQDDWHLNQSNEWKKVNCNKDCKHTLLRVVKR